MREQDNNLHSGFLWVGKHALVSEFTQEHQVHLKYILDTLTLAKWGLMDLSMFTSTLEVIRLQLDEGSKPNTHTLTQADGHTLVGSGR